MGVYALLVGSNFSFFFAETTAQQNGKIMEIGLWDPGEGALNLEILNPLGNPVSFQWQVDCSGGVTAPTGGCGPATSSNLDLFGVGNCSGSSPCNPQPGLRRGSTSKYSDRLLTLRVQLPSNIAAAPPIGYGGNTWWRIRYTVSAGGVTDRTTWSVRILGDPVRLVPDP